MKEKLELGRIFPFWEELTQREQEELQQILWKRHALRGRFSITAEVSVRECRSSVLGRRGYLVVAEWRRNHIISLD